MFDLTPRATRQLERVRRRRRVPDNQGLRLVPDGTGSLWMVFDTAHRNDVVIASGAHPLVIVDRETVESLTRVVLDYKPELRRAGLGRKAGFMLVPDDGPGADA